MGVCEQRDGGAAVRVKVVPGAGRSRVAGVLGDRLKVHVAAPPQEGRANAALCELLAGLLGVAPRDVTVAAGHGHPRKTVLVRGMDARAVEDRLAAPPGATR